MWMNVLKDSAKRIANGILFGVGFGIAAGLIYYFISVAMSEKMMKSMWNEAGVEKLVITSQDEVKRDDGNYILGTIENRGGESVRMASLQADLFDQAGKFVDQCSGYMGSSLKAGEVRNFKVTCGGKDKPVAEHASYKLRVVGM
jgi:hypothetical protein